MVQGSGFRISLFKTSSNAVPWSLTPSPQLRKDRQRFSQYSTLQKQDGAQSWPTAFCSFR